MIMSSIVAPAGIIGSTFSSFSITHSIHDGLSFFKDFGIEALTVKRAIKIGSIVLLVLYFAVLGGGGFVVKLLRRFRTVKS